MSVRRVREESALVFGTASAVLASFIAAHSVVAASPVDRALPLLAVALLAVAWLVRREAGSEAVTARFIEISIVPLIVVAIAVADPRIRLLSYGLILAIALVCAAAGLMRHGALSFGPSFAMSLVAVGIARATPIDGRLAISWMIVLVGVAILLASMTFSGMVLVDRLALVVVIGIVSPALPLRGALVPAFIGLLIFVVRRLSIASVLTLVLVSLAIGRWALIASIAIIGIQLAKRWVPGRWDRAFAIPAVRLESAGALLESAARAATIAPRLIFGAHPSAVRLLSALTLIALAFFGRPAVASLLTLSALAILLADERIEEAHPLSVVTVVVATFAIITFAWSGVGFPIDATSTPTSMMIAVTAVAMTAALYRWRIAGVVALIVAIGCASWVLGQVPVRDLIEPISASLKPGERFIHRLSSPREEIRVVISGSNVDTLARGEVVGQLEIVSTAGRGYRRPVRIGDIADWGSFRLGHRFTTRNPFPESNDEPVEGFGLEAFRPGSGAVEIRAPEGMIELFTLTASNGLPTSSRLQLERVESRQR